MFRFLRAGMVAGCIQSLIIFGITVAMNLRFGLCRSLGRFTWISGYRGGGHLRRYRLGLRFDCSTRHAGPHAQHQING